MSNHTSDKSAFMIEGIVFVILGVLAILLPTFTTYSITILIGVLSLAVGVVQGFRVFQNRNNTSFFPALISAVLAIIIGILLLAFPTHSIMVLTVLLSIWFFIHGIVEISFSFHLKKITHNWIYMLLSGIASLILALIIWGSWPLSATWMIGLLLGINLLLFGVALIATSYRMKESSL